MTGQPRLFGDTASPAAELQCGPYTVVTREPLSGRWATTWQEAASLVADGGTVGGLHDSPSAAFDALEAAGWTVDRQDRVTASVHRTGCPLRHPACTATCRGPELKPWHRGTP